MENMVVENKLDVELYDVLEIEEIMECIPGTLQADQ